MIEQTLILVKPDAVQRGLIGEVLSRYERHKLIIKNIKHLQISLELAQLHYREHMEKAFFSELVSYITSGPVIAAIIEGEAAIQTVRSINGATDPQQAKPGTIRRDFGLSINHNVVHASDSTAGAAQEITIFFPENSAHCGGHIMQGVDYHD